jgi:hypothetical protein
MVNGLLLALILPLGLLAHELGHALVALRLTDGPVTVLVGRQPGLVRFRIGRLRFSLHLWPTRDTDWGGVCLHEPAGLPRDLMYISLAGPIASLLWAIACATASVLWGHELDGFGNAALVLGVVVGAIEFGYHTAAALIPRLRTAQPRADGAKFEQAFRAHRWLRSIERELGRSITKSELKQMIETKRPPADLLPTRGYEPSRVSSTGAASVRFVAAAPRLRSAKKKTLRLQGFRGSG